MKYLFNILSTMMLGWPALIAGYVFAAIRSGWRTGVFLQDRHEDAAIEKFTRRSDHA